MLARLLPLAALASATAVLVVSACSGSESGGSGGTAGHGGSSKSSGGSSSTQGGSTSKAGTSAVAGTTAGGSSNGGADSSPGGVAGEPTAAAGETSLGGAAGGDGNLGAGGAGACKIAVAEQALAPGNHVTLCSDVTYATNPPSSGNHYGVWADFGVYDFALPRGFWVHNLEHGAVVVTYNCPGGCADEVAAATAWLGKLTVDAACPGGTPRALLVPDPKLDVRWAASSWGYTLRSDCFDAEAFGAFYTAHAGMPPAPEIPVCSTGTNFRDPKNDACGANQ